jgi:hypothetical protein
MAGQDNRDAPGAQHRADVALLVGARTAHGLVAPQESRLGAVGNPMDRLGHTVGPLVGAETLGTLEGRVLLALGAEGAAPAVLGEALERVGAAAAAGAPCSATWDNISITTILHHILATGMCELVLLLANSGMLLPASCCLLLLPDCVTYPLGPAPAPSMVLLAFTKKRHACLVA